jgi:hypothetical protein
MSWVAVIEVVTKFRSAPEVPTPPSTTTVEPLLWTMRNQVAIPVALADESCVIALSRKAW